MLGDFPRRRSREGVGGARAPSVSLALSSFLTIEILFLPHQAEDVGCISHVDADHDLIQDAEPVEDDGALEGISAFGAGDERGPDEAFEMRVCFGDEADLLEELIGDSAVVDWQSRAEATCCAGENSTGVQVDGGLVCGGECDSR